jgi:exopolysaccharide biosynthesis polyprenyl glycosylphosphotransferase
MTSPRKNDILVPVLGVALDAAAIEWSFFVSYYLRFNTQVLKFLPLTEFVPPLSAYLLSSIVIIPLWLMVFESGRMYAARRNASIVDELFSIVKYVTLGMMIIMSAAFFYRTFSYSRVVFVVLWANAIVWIFLGRVILNRVERNLYLKGRSLRNAVIIGSNETAARVFSSLNRHPTLGYALSGYFGDPVARPELPLKCLGTLDDVADTLAEGDYDLALITLGASDHARLYRLVRECEGLNVEFLMVPDMIDLIVSGTEMRELEGIPFIRVKGVPMSAWGRMMKRSFDFVISFVLLVTFSPVMIVLAVLVKASSKGPIFYVQERLSENGKLFKIIKFRSMIVDAEKASGPVWSTKDDPRPTRIGTMLRVTSLDELPQLFNVLLGDMSLVGPRPERPFFVDQFKGVVPKYLDRHRVKTGMTGWAQVNGLRGDSPLEERVKYDIYYVEHWSLGFDLRILVRTLGAVLSEVFRRA